MKPLLMAFIDSYKSVVQVLDKQFQYLSNESMANTHAVPYASR